MLCVCVCVYVTRVCSEVKVEGNRVKKQENKQSVCVCVCVYGGRGLPVSAVVNPTHLLARLQQVKDPRSTSAFFLDLGVAALGFRLGLCVDVQSLLIGGVHTLAQEEVDRDNTRDSYCLNMAWITYKVTLGKEWTPTDLLTLQHM